MPQRRRYATRDELTDLITQQAHQPEHTVAEILDVLAAEGVQLDHLVKITVREDIPDGPA